MIFIKNTNYVSQNQPLLFAGCGDNSIYAFEMGYNKPKVTITFTKTYVKTNIFNIDYFFSSLF